MPPEKKSHLGENFRKAQPKLRVFTNGKAEVNAVRALQCSALAIEDTSLLKQVESVPVAQMAPVKYEKAAPEAKKGKLDTIPPEISINVFIQTTNYAEPGSISTIGKVCEGETARNTNLTTATIKMSELPKLLDHNAVSYVEAGENLKTPKPVVTNGSPAAPKSGDRRLGSQTDHKFGEGVLIGIIDVQGFDFSHPDFLDSNGNTRFMRIWDQGGDSRPSPHARKPDFLSKTFDYGSELIQPDMNAALKAAPGLGIPAYELEPQSQMAEGSHGTHVASIAAGNLGVARKAEIAAVLISIPDEATTDYERRRTSFYDSTRIAHAVDYLLAVADGRPISINISLGTNGHAHDGSSPLCRWIDAWLSYPGAAVTAAAGNAGQEKGETPDDFGYVMGRIHTSGKIPSRGLTADIELQVIGNGIADISENELEIWYSAQDHFGVSVRPPGMDWTEIVEPRQFIENRQLPDKSFLSIYNERYHPANGLNCISVYLSPFLNEQFVIGSRAGLWKIRLHGIEVRNGSYHGWIERDDPRKLGRAGEKDVWLFPSFFSESSNVDNSSVSSLACGQRIISVANLDEAREIINITSSQGPTRDGRTKPDVAAPGTNIVAAKGFNKDGNSWVGMSGTSMAAPYVTGLIGLMLAIQPKLTAAQIEGIIQSTASPLPGMDFKWLDTAGFGRIEPNKCLEQAKEIITRKDITK